MPETRSATTSDSLVSLSARCSGLISRQQTLVELIQNQTTAIQRQAEEAARNSAAVERMMEMLEQLQLPRADKQTTEAQPPLLPTPDSPLLATPTGKALSESELESKTDGFHLSPVRAEGSNEDDQVSSDVEETSDSILRPSQIRFDLKSDVVVTTMVRALPGLRPTVSVNFYDHCYFFLHSNMSVAGKKGENCSDIHCLQPVCENVKTSLPVYLPTAWSLFTSECGFFCFKKVKFKYFEPGEPPPLPPDIIKYLIIYKGALTDICGNINWCGELADFIIIWSFSIRPVHNDMKLWLFKVIRGSNIKLMILVHYIGEEKQCAYKNITPIDLIKMGELTEVYHCISLRNALDIVTAYFNGSRRQLTKNDGVIVGLNLVMINEPTTAVIVYGVNKKATSVGENTILILYLGGGDVSLLTIEENILDIKYTTDDIHVGGEEYDSKMINHFYPKLGKYNIFGNFKVQQHITEFDKATKDISSTTRTPIVTDTVTDIQGVIIIVYTWPKNYGDASKRKDLSTLLRGAATSISSDEKAVLREVAQSLFEGSIYTFELLQMILSPIDKEIPGLAKYMLAHVLGGSLVSRLTAHSATQVKCLVNIIILLFGDLSQGKPATIKHIVLLLEIVEVLDMYHHSRFWISLNFGSSVKARVDLCEGSGYLKWIRSIVLGLQVWLNQENVKGLLVSYFQSIHNIMGSASYKFPSKIKQQSSIHIWHLLINLCGHFSPLITKFGSEKVVSLSAMLVASSLTTSGSKTIINLSSVDSIPSTLFGSRLSNAQHKVRSTKINTTSTDMYFNHDSLAVQRMQAGVSKLADLGGVTLDPKRWNVVLHSEDKSLTIVADDGLATVQEALLENSIANSGAKLARCEIHNVIELDNQRFFFIMSTTNELCPDYVCVGQRKKLEIFWCVVITYELKSNLFAKWLAQVQLACTNVVKVVFVSRIYTGAKFHLNFLVLAGFKQEVFATQVTIWDIVVGFGFPAMNLLYHLSFWFSSPRPPESNEGKSSLPLLERTSAGSFILADRYNQEVETYFILYGGTVAGGPWHSICTDVSCFDNIFLDDFLSSAGYINHIFMFSLPRPPDIVDLEDKVILKEGGMLRAQISQSLEGSMQYVEVLTFGYK